MFSSRLLSSRLPSTIENLRNFSKLAIWYYKVFVCGGSIPNAYFVMLVTSTTYSALSYEKIHL